MAETKEIVVLANSIREENRCIAGKELFPNGDNYKIGPWIRLSEQTTKGGAVKSSTANIPGHGKARPLDIIKAVVESNCNNPDHPEDWLLQPGQPWKYVGSYQHDILPILVDPITSLWNDNSHSNSVAAGYVKKMGATASSLALIKAPHGWQFEFWKEIKPDFKTGYPKEKSHRDLKFAFGKHYHEFSVTDPDFMARHDVWKKMAMDHRQQIAFPNPENVYFCLSLTPEFNGHHYKIGATIFEPQ